METPATQRRKISADNFTMKNLEQELFREAKNLAALHGVEVKRVILTVMEDGYVSYFVAPDFDLVPAAFGVGKSLAEAVANLAATETETPVPASAE